MDRPLTPAGQFVVGWLAKKKKRRTWLAKQLGVDRVVLWRWLVGETTPHIDFAAAIEAITGLPARAWATDEGLREKRLPADASAAGKAKRLRPRGAPSPRSKTAAEPTPRRATR